MRGRSAAARVAYPAILGALSLVLLYLGTLVPTGNLGIVAVAGLPGAAAVISVSLQAGFLCWGAVSVLALLLVPDKLCVLLFAVLFGLYPMIKALIEGRRMKKALEYLLKLVFFNAAMTVVWAVMGAALLDFLPELLGRAWWTVYLAGNVVFLAYDYGFGRLIALYIARVRRAIDK